MKLKYVFVISLLLTCLYSLWLRRERTLDDIEHFNANQVNRNTNSVVDDESVRKSEEERVARDNALRDAWQRKCEPTEPSSSTGVFCGKLVLPDNALGIAANFGWTGHAHGLALYSQQLNLTYIPIPKTGSGVLRGKLCGLSRRRKSLYGSIVAGNAFAACYYNVRCVASIAQCDTTERGVRELDETVKFTFVRHPILRFVSGVSEILRYRDVADRRWPYSFVSQLSFWNETEDELRRMRLILREFEHNSMFDAHIIPQRHFIEVDGRYVRNLRVYRLEHAYVERLRGVEQPVSPALELVEQYGLQMQVPSVAETIRRLQEKPPLSEHDRALLGALLRVCGDAADEARPSCVHLCRRHCADFHLFNYGLSSFCDASMCETERSETLALRALQPRIDLDLNSFV